MLPVGRTLGVEPGLGQRFLVLGHGFRARISWSALGLGYGSDFVVRLRVKRLVVGARCAGIGNANLAITIDYYHQCSAASLETGNAPRLQS